MRCSEFDILVLSTTTTPRQECGAWMEPRIDQDDKTVADIKI